MKEKIIDILRNKKVVSYIIIFFVALCICIPLFSKNMDISRDDGIQHICRIIGSKSSIKTGNIFPVIMAGFCNGFGYSWDLFYSPLTASLPLIFTLFTSSYVMCLKLFMLFTMFLSGIFMYKLVYTISKSHKAAVFSGLIYITAPYHLTDLYNRIAIAELASFVFLPIVFTGVYDLINKKGKKAYYISIGAIGLILSHNVLAVYAAIFCFIYLIVNHKKLINKKILKNIAINFVIIILATSFYWLPLLQHYFVTTYEVFVPGRMFQNNTLISSKLDIADLFFKEHYGMIFHIGIPTIIGVLLLFIYRNKISKRYRNVLAIFICFGLVSVAMSLKIFPFERLPNVLKMIQFQWRMLEFSSFFLSIAAGIGIGIFMNSKNRKSLVLIILTILVVYSGMLLKDSFHKVEIPFKEENYISPIPVTSLTGRVHAGCATFEYLPQKAFSNRYYIETRSQDVIVLEGNANILNTHKENTDLSFDLENVSENTKLELPYIFYLGYNAKLVDENGNKTKLKIQESDKGFCMIVVPNIDKGNVTVSYTGTGLMKFSYILTLIGFSTLIIYTIKLKKY